MVPRFHVPAEQLGDDAERVVALDREQSHYLLNALRLRAGDALQVFDGRGRRYDARIDVADRGRCSLRVGLPATGSPGPSPVAITLLQGLAAGDRMDWIIEKAVELGVDTIVPVRCGRSVVKLSDDRADKRHAHWQRIAIAACMQSGRDDLPTIAPITPLADLFRGQGSIDLPAHHTCVLDPLASESLTDWLGSPATERRRAIACLIGPESGLAPDELAMADRYGCRRVGLGPRVLRTETAGIVAAAVIQSAVGDFARV